MKKEVADKWVEALRSKEFSQTQNFLKKDDGYCCLGVLCELHMREFGGKWIEGDVLDGYEYLKCTGILPPEVIEWAGMDDDIGSLNDEECLSQLNDKGKSFVAIADIIEKNWEKL